MDNLSTQESTIRFSELEDLGLLPNDYKDDILNADIVIMPRVNEYRSEGKVFTEDTMKYFKTLQAYTEDVKVEICADDEDFHELALHSDEITLPMLLVTGIGFPTAVNFIWHYINKYILMPRNDKDVNVSVSIIVDENGNAKQIDYSGKAEDFESVIDQMLRLKNDDN